MTKSWFLPLWVCLIIAGPSTGSAEDRCDNVLAVDTYTYFVCKDEADLVEEIKAGLVVYKQEKRDHQSGAGGSVSFPIKGIPIRVKGEAQRHNIDEIEDYLNQTNAKNLKAYQYRNLLEMAPQTETTKAKIDAWLKCITLNTGGLQLTSECNGNVILVTVIWHPEGRQRNPIVNAVNYRGATPLGGSCRFKKKDKIESGVWTQSFVRSDPANDFQLDLDTSVKSISTKCEGRPGLDSDLVERLKKEILTLTNALVGTNRTIQGLHNEIASLNSKIRRLQETIVALETWKSKASQVVNKPMVSNWNQRGGRAVADAEKNRLKAVLNELNPGNGAILKRNSAVIDTMFNPDRD